MRVLPLSLVESGFHNIPRFIHNEVTRVIHEAEIRGYSPHIMEKGRIGQGPTKINVTQLLPWGAPFLQLLATVIKCDSQTLRVPSTARAVWS